MKRYEEHITKWVDTKEKFARYFRQSVCDYYRHADTKEVFEEKMAACEKAAKRFEFTVAEFAAKREEFEAEFKAFYADKKTIAACMAYSH